jgi:hypothetical protein
MFESDRFHRPVIPYTRIFREGEERHQIIQATILSMTQTTVTVSYTPQNSTHIPGGSSTSPDALFPGGGQQTISFEFAIYALGASLPDPINVWKPLETPYVKPCEGREPVHKDVVSSSPSGQLFASYLKVVGDRATGLNLTAPNFRQFRGSNVHKAVFRTAKAW